MANMDIKEKDIQKQIIKYLLMKGHYVWRNNTGMMRQESRFIHFGKRGSSDILGCQKGTGKLIAIEVKAKHGKTTPFQDEFAKNVQERGGIAIVARSIEDVIAIGL